MIKNIELFYDKELKNKVEGDITFEPIPVGEKTEKVIYLKNNLNVQIKDLIISIIRNFSEESFLKVSILRKLKEDYLINQNLNKQKLIEILKDL